MAKHKRRAKKHSSPPRRPKGSYPLPNGNYVVTTYHRTKSGKALRIRAVHRAEPDVRRVTEALTQIATRWPPKHHD
jgi:hypothetical protein